MPFPIKPSINMNKSIMKKADTNAQIVSNGLRCLSKYVTPIPVPIKNACIFSSIITQIYNNYFAKTNVVCNKAYIPFVVEKGLEGQGKKWN
jgi:hypothetical protein